MDLTFQGADADREITRQTGQFGPIDQDARLLHPYQNGYQGSFQGFIDRMLAFRQQARFEIIVQAQSQISIFGCIFRRFVQGDPIEGNP